MNNKYPIELVIKLIESHIKSNKEQIKKLPGENDFTLGFRVALQGGIKALENLKNDLNEAIKRSKQILGENDVK